jgi:hypothetical protein
MKPKRNGSRIPIDYDLASKVALLNPSNDELAWALDISRATLYRRLQDDEQLREILEAGRHGRRLSLKRAQWKAAMEGNTALLIWLGKQELGQREPDRQQMAEIASDFSVEEIQVAALKSVQDYLTRAIAEGQSLEDVAKLIDDNRQRLKSLSQNQQAKAADGDQAAQYDMPSN